ncbi:MAG: fibronectin type III domain-containing protein, partial [Gemmatimonadota bacterium]
GNGDGPAPATPADFTVQRLADRRDADVSWTPVPGAVGYNVRWGIAPDKLHQTYQVFFDRPQPLHVRSLNVGPTYWFAIEAFNESGVSKLSRVVQVP